MTFVKFNGGSSESKVLPGGGPQGTLLGLLLFIILINDCGFVDNRQQVGKTITGRKKFESSTLHTKYVDDLSVMESINLKETLVSNPDRPKPDQYHARLGQKLNPSKSKVYEQIRSIQKYAQENQIQHAKCKFMLFNPTINFVFIPEFILEEMKRPKVEIKHR